MGKNPKNKFAPLGYLVKDLLRALFYNFAHNLGLVCICLAALSPFIIYALLQYVP